MCKNKLASKGRGQGDVLFFQSFPEEPLILIKARIWGSDGDEEVGVRGDHGGRCLSDDARTT